MQLYRAFQTVMIPRGIYHLGQSNSLSDFHIIGQDMM